MESKYKKTLALISAFILTIALVISSILLNIDESDFRDSKFETEEDLKERISVLENFQLEISERAKLGEILNHLDLEGQGLEIEIHKIEEKENGFEISYTAHAKEDLYLPDYNSLNCENEIKRRLIVDENLYFVFHLGHDFYCDPFVLYQVPPPWPVALLKEGEEMNFTVPLHKEWFGNDSYKKESKNIERVKFIFGYVPRKNLEKSEYSFEQLDGKTIIAFKQKTPSIDHF